MRYGKKTCENYNLPKMAKYCTMNFSATITRVNYALKLTELCVNHTEMRINYIQRMISASHCRAST